MKRIREGQGNSGYKKYLSSGRWDELKSLFLTPKSRCKLCGKEGKLTLHHKSYENLGKETLDDFIILCTKCHVKIHFNKKGILRKLYRTNMEYQKRYAKGRRKEINNERLIRRALSKIEKEGKFSCAKRYSKTYCNY